MILDINVTKATTKELLDFYNENVAKFGWDSVKRFSDRTTAERRVTAMLENLAGKVSPDPSPMKRNAKAAEPIAPKTKPARIAIAKAKAPTGRTQSEGIAQSWLDPEVAAARKTHHHVTVDGVTYRSVRDAFDKLGLPIEKHIRFRKTLKDTGKANFDGHHFALVERDEAS